MFRLLIRRTAFCMRHFATSVIHTIYFGSLLLNYVLKLKSLLENPAYSCVFEPENIKLFEESEFKISPLDIRTLPHLEKSKINLNLIDDATSLDIAPWTLSDPTAKFFFKHN